MKRIVKGKEPQSLLEHRLKLYADYNNYPEKNDLRASLLSEQGYICCYCMQRINDERIKIEHWKPQDENPELQLIYSNLLGACQGGQGFPRHLQHCDTRKSNSEITINPLDSNKSCENLVKYRANGEIYSDDEAINDDLNEVLNLNMQTLVNNRRDVLQLIIQKLTKERATGNWTAAMLTQKINYFSNQQQDGMYKPYCQIVIYHLKKKLSSLHNIRK